MAQLARQAARSADFRDRVLEMGPGVIDTLRSRFRYRGELNEIVRSPEFMLHDLNTLGYVEGDCDDISTLVAAVMAVRGVPARLVATIYTPGVVNYQHVFVETLNGVQIDLTVAPGTRQAWIRRMEEAI